LHAPIRQVAPRNRVWLAEQQTANAGLSLEPGSDRLVGFGGLHDITRALDWLFFGI
jgi:hypothetical protein